MRSVFDDKRSFFHFLLGVFCVLIPILGIGVFWVFLIYEVFDKDRELNRLGDFIEFVSGVAYGIIIKSVWVFIL